jgi:pSer/pThr/pTyr-binding forkhead associated (FHA) protein
VNEQAVRLRVTEGPDAGREFGLEGSAVIGRSARRADLVLHDPEVSRRHASLHLHDDGLRVEDLHSTNGTFLNDERVTGHRQVEPGDRLKIGMTVLELEVAEEAEPEQDTPVEAKLAEEAAVEVEPEERAGEPVAEEEPTAIEEPVPEEPEPEPEREDEPEEEPEEPAPEEEEPEPEPAAEQAAEPEPEEPAPAAEAEPEPEEPEAEEQEPEEPEPAEEPAPEAPPAGVIEAISTAEIAKDLHSRVVESFAPVLHAWSNRDVDEMRPYVSDAYLDRTIDALEELENDFQINSIEELDLKDVAVRRPSGGEAERGPVEAYLAFLARDWIEDLRSGEVLDGDSSEIRAFLERWTFVREGRRGWVIDRVESVWTGSLDEAASQAWPGLPSATYSRRNRPSTWRRWDGTRWVTESSEKAAAATG